MNASSNALPPTNLAGSFNKPATRAATIRLPGGKPAAPPAVKAVPEPPVAPEEPVKAAEPPQKAQKAPQAAPKVRKAVKGPEKAPKTAQDAPAATADLELAGNGILVLWTPVAIRDRMAAYKRETGITYLEQALRALDANAGSLPELLAEPEIPTAEVTTSALGLVHTQVPIVKAPKRVQLTIRGLIAANAKVIDDLAGAHAGGSRSKLINAVLDAWLPTTT